MKLLYDKDFLVKFDNKLVVYDIEGLKEIYMNKNENITSVALSESILYYGCGDGSIYSFNLNSFEKTLVGNHSQSVSSVYLLDNFLYSSSSDGYVHKYIISDLVDSSSNEDTTFRLIKSFKHNTPIHDLISDGEDILVSDMRNKVTIYPSNKIYDMESPLFLYKNYVFAAEKNILYCKTRQALASYIKTDSKIAEFKFNRNGGLLFIRFFDKIQIYDFNKKELLKEIEQVLDCFVYDEDHNRLIGFLGKEMVVVDNVIDENVLKIVSNGMGCVKFEDMKIYEKSVKITEDEEYETHKLYENKKVKYNLIKEDVNSGIKGEVEDESGKMRKKKRHKKKEITKETENVNYFPKEKIAKAQKTRRIVLESDYEVSENEYLSDTEKLESLFEDSSKISKKVNTGQEEKILEPKIKLVNLFPIKTEDCWLFYYNEIGYLRSLISLKFSKIELIFHDTKRTPIEIEDNKGFLRGSFYEENIVMSNNTNLFFYGKKNNWNKLMFNKYVAINNKYILVHNEITTLLDYEGNETFNFYIKDITSISFFDDFIAIFGRQLTIINLFKTTEDCYLPDKVTWSCFDKKGRLWYKIKDDVYLLYKKLSCKVFNNINNPLSIVGNNLLCLNNSFKLLPVPHIDFKEIPQNIASLLENEQNVSSYKLKENFDFKTSDKENKVCNNKIQDDFEPDKINSLQVLEDSLSDDFDIFSEKHDTPTKKFNPLSDL